LAAARPPGAPGQLRHGAGPILLPMRATDRYNPVLDI
jgi:hypothetical protein